ncbi:MAG: lysylphosphatidylglycerol synthase transmembrane domain-containing protein [Planctomycetota bacterium]
MPPKPPTPDTLDVPPVDSGGKRSWLAFIARWTIAIVGIAWVLSQLTIRDRVYVLQGEGDEIAVYDLAVEEPFDPAVDDEVVVASYETGEPKRVSVDRLLNGPDAKGVDLVSGSFELAAMRLTKDASGDEYATTIYYFTPESGDGYRVVEHDASQGFRYTPQPPQPLVRTGLANMVRGADPSLLVAAIAVFPATLIFTGLRWWRLMSPLGIEMPLRKAFVLNMVGLFYNSFMLGSTGGDFVKAFYAGRYARPGYKAAAWMSVFVDRLIGLLVLVAIGGTAATIQYAMTDDKSSPVAVACVRVATVAVVMMIATVVVGIILSSAPTRQVIRTRTGLGRVLDKAAPRYEDLPDEVSDRLSDRIKLKARDGLDALYTVAEAYRSQPMRVVESSLLTVPVHGAVIISAMLAGVALGLPIPWPYYFVCVPVIVLSASMPVSPQGAGVMEFFAVILTKPQGATVAQAFALALCIRVVQILWNLTGGIFVLRGGFGKRQEHELETDVDDSAQPVPAT